jgi:hypothetical protein
MHTVILLDSNYAIQSSHGRARSREQKTRQARGSTNVATRVASRLINMASYPPPNEPEQGFSTHRTKITERTMMSTSASNDNQPHPRRRNNTRAHNKRSKECDEDFIRSLRMIHRYCLAFHRRQQQFGGVAVFHCFTRSKDTSDAADRLI